MDLESQSNEFDYENVAEELADAEDGGDGADRVGTLLVRMGQLDGVGGMGLLSLAPKAVATLMLEESSATLEEMDLGTNFTQVPAACWCFEFLLGVWLCSHAGGLAFGCSWGFLDSYSYGLSRCAATRPCVAYSSVLHGPAGSPGGPQLFSVLC